MPQAATEESIRAALLNFLSESILAKGVAFEDDTPLASLGVDSMSLVQILLFIERQFGVQVPDEELTRANTETINALTACIVRHSGDGNST